jgi:hypothetical protein
MSVKGLVTKNIANSSYNNVILLEVNRKNLGNPDGYKDYNLSEFLKEAKKRAEKIEQMINQNK